MVEETEEKRQLPGKTELAGIMSSGFVPQWITDGLEAREKEQKEAVVKLAKIENLNKARAAKAKKKKADATVKKVVEVGKVDIDMPKPSKVSKVNRGRIKKKK